MSNRTLSDFNSLQLIGIYEISKILGATISLDRALFDVLNILSSYLSMRHGAVVLAREDGSMELAATIDRSLDEARRDLAPYPLAAAQTVVRTGLPMVVADASREPMLANTMAAGTELEDETVSFLCVPIKTAERTVGALSVARIWDDQYHHVFEHDVRFLTMVATLLGQTIRLHQRIQADRALLMAETGRLRKVMENRPLSRVRGLEDVIGTSDAMARVFAQVQQVAPTRATVLLRGESGTGKEMIARAVHILSQRAKKPFIRVNCAALSETLLESELFGHEKGAFTGANSERKGRFEMADGGSLFLDEIGEISPAFQAKLLRVLQEGEFERVGGNRTLKVDVRLIAATNRDLETAVAKGEFRADLYYRLNVVPIVLPPLRDRPDDIPLLAMYFLKRFNEENGANLQFAERALKTLQECNFPGNVRELENCVYRTATLTQTPLIDELALSCRRGTCLSSVLWLAQERAAQDRLGGVMVAPPVPPPVAGQAPANVPPPTPSSPAPSSPPPSVPVTVAPEDPAPPANEREALIQAMERAGWVQAKAARLLGLTPRQIGYALKKHNIPLRRF